MSQYNQSQIILIPFYYTVVKQSSMFTRAQILNSLCTSMNVYNFLFKTIRPSKLTPNKKHVDITCILVIVDV